MTPSTRNDQEVMKTMLRDLAVFWEGTVTKRPLPPFFSHFSNHFGYHIAFLCYHMLLSHDCQALMMSLSFMLSSVLMLCHLFTHDVISTFVYQLFLTRCHHDIILFHSTTHSVLLFPTPRCTLCFFSHSMAHSVLLLYDSSCAYSVLTHSFMTHVYITQHVFVIMLTHVP